MKPAPDYQCRPALSPGTGVMIALRDAKRASAKREKNCMSSSRYPLAIAPARGGSGTAPRWLVPGDQAFADRLRDQLMVRFRPQYQPGVTQYSVDLPGRDSQTFGDLGLTQPLASKIDGFDLLFCQFRHKRIESFAGCFFKSPPLGTGLRREPEVSNRRGTPCQ